MTDQLHYPGDCTQFDPDWIMGPDMFGAYYRVTAGEYDGHRSTLTLVPVPPAELQKRTTDRIAAVAEYQRIRTLFASTS